MQQAIYQKTAKRLAHSLNLAHFLIYRAKKSPLTMPFFINITVAVCR
jgi:hypothetical protein